MQTFSSNRKHGLRVLLKLHKVPVKKRETGMAQKKKGKRHQQLQNATYRIATIDKLKIAQKFKKTKTCQSYQLIVQISLSLACKTH